MCVANSARSQMAEGLAKKYLKGTQVESAGSNPSTLNPYAVGAMQEVGIDISKNYSKTIERLSPVFLADLDYVITLCAEEVCPVVITKAKKLHWPIDDPASKEALGETVFKERFRKARDILTEKIKTFKP